MLLSGLHQNVNLRFLTPCLHWLLPPVCLLCGTSLRHTTEQYLCSTCSNACLQQPTDACNICSEPFSASSSVEHSCGHCRSDPPPFIWLKTLGLHEKTLRHAIQQLKYAHRFQLARPLAHLLLHHLQAELEAFAPDAVVPVPLHKSRLRQRGFNQALLVGRHIGKAMDIPVYTRHLQRIRPTRSQTDLNRKQRHANLNGAFVLQDQLPATRILLIDDVATTTATARACAGVLTRAGCQVAVAALSRARLQD